MNSQLARNIESLKTMSVAALKERFAEIFGKEPKSSNRQFLFRRIPWQLQAKAEGGLSERAQQRVAEIAHDGDLRMRAPRGFMAAQPLPAVPKEDIPFTPGTRREWRIFAAGSIIRRRFRGREIVVKILGKGFEYDGRTYGSLSAVARQVTGTNWNGIRFFGLADGRDK